MVDGRLVRTIDLAAKSVTYGVNRTISGLKDKEHTVEVVVVGAPEADGSGRVVAIDGWTVR